MARGVLAKHARKCCVYLVTDAAKNVKVGRSSRLAARLSELGVASAGGVALAHSWKLKIAEAVDLERSMHQALKPLRVSGEWFKAGVGDVRGVGDLLIVGNVDDAARLVAALKDEYRLSDEARRLHREFTGLINFHAARKRELRALIEANDEAYERARELSLSLGAYPDERELWWRERMEALNRVA